MLEELEIFLLQMIGQAADAAIQVEDHTVIDIFKKRVPTTFPPGLSSEQRTAAIERAYKYITDSGIRDEIYYAADLCALLDLFVEFHERKNTNRELFGFQLACLFYIRFLNPLLDKYQTQAINKIMFLGKDISSHEIFGRCHQAKTYHGLYPYLQIMVSSQKDYILEFLPQSCAFKLATLLYIFEDKCKKSEESLTAEFDNDTCEKFLQLNYVINRYSEQLLPFQSKVAPEPVAQEQKYAAPTAQQKPWEHPEDIIIRLTDELTRFLVANKQRFMPYSFIFSFDPGKKRALNVLQQLESKEPDFDKIIDSVREEKEGRLLTTLTRVSFIHKNKEREQVPNARAG